MSKLLWKFLSNFSRSNDRLRVGDIEWPEPFSSTKSDAIVGIDISKNPRILNLSEMTNVEFWEAVKSDDVLYSKL